MMTTEPIFLSAIICRGLSYGVAGETDAILDPLRVSTVDTLLILAMFYN